MVKARTDRSAMGFFQGKTKFRQREVLMIGEFGKYLESRDGIERALIMSRGWKGMYLDAENYNSHSITQIFFQKNELSPGGVFSKSKNNYRAWLLIDKNNSKYLDSNDLQILINKVKDYIL